MTDTHIIVIGNEKGGTGKSTLAVNLAIKLLYEGLSVATMDFDGRQGSLSKYIENRQNFMAKNDINLPCPQNIKIEPKENTAASCAEIELLIDSLKGKFDALIIDTPGSKNYLFDEAYKFADTLITPITDSMVDLSVLADIDAATGKIIKPSHYANFVWNIKKQLAAQGKPFLNWMVVGSKVSAFNSNNKRIVFEHLQAMSKLFGFRFFSGLKDRAIYKEMFLDGLTVCDMQHEKLKLKMTISHLAAKREVAEVAENICPQK